MGRPPKKRARRKGGSEHLPVRLNASRKWKKEHPTPLKHPGFNEWLRRIDLSIPCPLHKQILYFAWRDGAIERELNVPEVPYSSTYIARAAEQKWLTSTMLRVHFFSKAFVMTQDMKKLERAILSASSDPNELRTFLGDSESRIRIPYILRRLDHFCLFPEKRKSLMEALAHALLQSLPSRLSGLATTTVADEFLRYLCAEPEQALPLDKLFEMQVARRTLSKKPSPAPVTRQSPSLTEECQILARALQEADTAPVTEIKRMLDEREVPFDGPEWRTFRCLLNNPDQALRDLVRELRKDEKTVITHLRKTRDAVRQALQKMGLGPG